MKKKNLRSLKLQKKTVSKLSNNYQIKGGVSGACTSSVDPHECYFACPESVYTPCD